MRRRVRFRFGRLNARLFLEQELGRASIDGGPEFLEIGLHATFQKNNVTTDKEEHC